MIKILTPSQAWEQFYTWALSPENVAAISPDNKHYLQKTALDMASGKCGNQRLKNIFQKFAPGMFEFIDLSGFKSVCQRCGGSGIDPYPGHSTTVPPCPECQ